MTLVVKLVLAPLLVVGSSLAGRRWGPGLTGLLVAMPVVAGPILLITYVDHGAAFAARAASASLLGLVSLAAFAVVFAWVARGRGWLGTVFVGWLVCLVLDLALSFAPVPAWAAVGLALAAAWGGTRLVPASGEASLRGAGSVSLPGAEVAGPGSPGAEVAGPRDLPASGAAGPGLATTGEAGTVSLPRAEVAGPRDLPVSGVAEPGLATTGEAGTVSLPRAEVAGPRDLPVSGVAEPGLATTGEAGTVSLPRAEVAGPRDLPASGAAEPGEAGPGSLRGTSVAGPVSSPGPEVAGPRGLPASGVAEPSLPASGEAGPLSTPGPGPLASREAGQPLPPSSGAAEPSSMRATSPVTLPWWDLPARALATAALVLALTAAAGRLGPDLTGVLAPFPTGTSVVAAFALAQGGPAAAVATMRGVLRGLRGFAAFCFLTAVLAELIGAWAFAIAVAGAVAVQWATRNTKNPNRLKN
ncbi:hypothetical protein [Amycolatopsis sp. cg9]|uniref:hypothetical protein n=1 Tax=Amycolatopsis sp. cg9 TaxID=3238801 RepID=UPI003525A1D8